MKEILISIKPKWVELIASGEKTIEVRKTRPKIKTPFKCYICCREKVVGEFVCNAIYEIIKECGKYIALEDDNSIIECLTKYVAKQSCLCFDCIDKYLKGNHGYGWQISDLKIYDEPKRVSDFVKPCDRESDCCACRRWNYSAQNCEDSITTPPKTFCYVEKTEG